MNDCNYAVRQGEYTFPGLLSTDDCHAEIQEIKRRIRPHRIALWILLILYVIFMILTVVLAVTAVSSEFDIGIWDAELGKYVHEKADYTGTIICAVLCGLTIVAGIANLILVNRSVRGLHKEKDLKFMIEVNKQYSAFIMLGYDLKEAYRLTLEWADRQAYTDAIGHAAATVSASVLFTGLMKK